MLHRLFVGSLLFITLSLRIVPAVQREVTYSVHGRVVDGSGRQVAGATVILDPPVWAHQAFGATTDDKGRFNIEDTTTVRRSMRRLYITGPTPPNTVCLIEPPFNRLPKLKDARFAGKRLHVEPGKEIDVGDTPLQVSYILVNLFVQNGDGVPMLTTAQQWKPVYLRLRNERNVVVTETSLSQNQIENAVNLVRSSIALAIPEGIWRVELSTGGYVGPWHISDGRLNLKRLAGAHNLTLKVGLQ